MKKNIIILDGYNIIHQIPELEKFLDQDLAKARDGLSRLCRNWLASRKDIWLFYIVFDGSSDVPNNETQSARDIRIIYTKTNETADTRILDILEERKNDCNATIVSEDNFVKRQSRLLGAKIMSVSSFAATAAGKSRNAVRSMKYSGKNDLTPSQQKDINDSLKKHWGLD